MTSPMQNNQLSPAMRLKVIMAKRKLKNKDVAQITGRTLGTVNSWTSGARVVPEQFLIMLEQGVSE